MSDELKIHVLAVGEDVPAFIFAVFGHIDLTSLSDIEDQINDEESEYEPGEYIFNVSYESEQRGEYGAVEHAAYWDLTISSYKTFEQLEIENPLDK